MSLLVSVIIPNYNYGRFVCDAVESVLSQTYGPIETIVIDDGSTDDSRERLATFGDRVRVVHQANAGLSAARNTGLRCAAGELIALLDSDDAFHPEKIATQVAFLAENRDVGLVATASTSGTCPTWSGISQPLQSTSITRDSVVLKARFSPSSVMIRKDAAHRVGDFDVTLKSAEDRDYWIRVGAMFPMAYLTPPLTFARTGHTSMSSNAERMERFERIVLERAFADPKLGSDPLLKRRAYAIALNSMAWTYRTQKRPGTAMMRLLESFSYWPFSLQPDVRHNFERAVQFAYAALEMARVRQTPKE